MKQKLYTLDYSNPSGTVRLDKYDVPLPKMPALSEMINYGKPAEAQFFERTVVPKGIFNRKSHLSTAEQEFIANEWHKRKNGIWILIKGQPVYITGPYYVFLNYWRSKTTGNAPEFRYAQCLFFMFWDMVVRDENCYGVDLIKSRRFGGTEITVFIIWEYNSRVRNSKGGMQSKNEKTVYKNFKRLTYGNKRMIWFFKPVQNGSDDPQEILEFRYPSKAQTDKTNRDIAASDGDDNVYSEREMSSEIDFRPCEPLAYDGEELNRYTLNESGKLERMSLLDCWDKVKPCLHYFDGQKIVGKALFESTIEELDDNQIEEVNQLAQDSNPLERDANGRTTSGLYLLFVNYLEGAMPDKWGFPMKDEAKIFHDQKIDALKKQKKTKEITNLLRKEPEILEDALMPSGSQSAFNKDRLQDALKRIDYPEAFGFKETAHTVRGNLVWMNGVPDVKTLFIEDENGRFVISQQPKLGEECAYVEVGGIKFPANSYKYRGGVDPYEHDEVVDEKRASKGAGVIMRMYDDNEDGAKKNEDGSAIDFGWEWKSKQPVCHYLHRDDDPDMFFEDMIKMHFHYGCQMNVENNKVSIKKYFRRRGYQEYLMARPESTMEPTARTQTVNQIGTPATVDTIEQYFNAIASYIMQLGNAIKHRELILDLLELNKKNRTKHDLGVALGWSLIACEKLYYRTPTTETKEIGNSWFNWHTI